MDMIGKVKRMHFRDRLSFSDIARRTGLSRNTVKTQAISVYRKLDASSRSEAISRARALGLVDSVAPRVEFILSG